MVIDRRPPAPIPGTISVSPSPIRWRFTTGVPEVTLTRPAYPSPPAGVTLNADDPNVKTMYDRLSGYYAGREPLPSMAYFCFTVFLSPFSGNRNVRRTAASAHYHIDKQVLDEIGDLSSEKGGPDSARKVGAMGSALSRKEERFLEAAVKMIIRRAAEVAQNPGAAFPPITLAPSSSRLLRVARTTAARLTSPLWTCPRGCSN